MRLPILMAAAIAAAPLVATAGGPLPVPLTAEQVRRLPPARFDHHLHIFGPAAHLALTRMLARYPDLSAQMDPDMAEIRTGGDVLKQLDQAGIRKGALLSAAYMVGSPMADFGDADVRRLTRQENQYNVDAALASHGRLRALISVNPLRADAIEEMRYWAGRPGVAGLKLHLANSGFDWASDADYRKVAAIFAEARRLRLPIVVHLRNGPAYDPARFIALILPSAGDLPVQIAHIGGYGGIDAETIAALRLFAEAIDRKAPGTRHLVFDLAALDLSAAEHAARPMPSPSLEQARQVVALMRHIGLSRFVIGSDWPGLASPARHNAFVERALPLTPAEWRGILANEAPYAR